jgi:hypothetical protein
MAWPANHGRGPREQIFLIDFIDAPDAVVRLLGPFAVQGCRLLDLGLEPRSAGARLRVHASAMDPSKADQLRHRLAALPLVQAVTVGWRTSAQAPDGP